MDNVIVSNMETRKEWAAPELKKVDIEQITAASTSGSTFDGDKGVEVS
jgi:hypothetical protein